MLLWIMVFTGILIFIPGIYFLTKNYKQGKYIKKYGELSYIGLGLIVLGVILLMEPVFTKLPGSLSGVLPAFIALFIFMIASRLLLKPAFLKK
ncbi:hypothetical protein GCM10008904_04410 [Paraclostridium ghonii]|uniref:Membrane-bound ClpP family serine protease n=1 Tax=Paraclostridium ghonii TaxID=29358 RepID=A0ABU0N2G6_9FIRM|nr:hypothetical protein [Paeniclostridium ghonii]MDQ0557352.1 membrane-bound ClpP family serine protease [Paeniclostridium ghonii]